MNYQNIHVNRNRMEPNRIYAGTRGSYITDVSFSFSGEWEGLTKKLIFYPVRGTPVYTVYTYGTVRIPARVMRNAGISVMLISGYRVREDGKIGEKIITASASVLVESAESDIRNEPDIPEATVFEEIVAKLGAPYIGESGNWYIWDVDTHEFVDTGLPARGEKGETGRGLTILGKYSSLDELRESVKDAQPGDAYAVGAKAPYTIYIWDAVLQDFTDHGDMRGVGISGIEQITDNTGSGEPNTIRITTDDGARYDYTVYNGERGHPGNIWIGETEPTDDSYTIWLNPGGAVSGFVESNQGTDNAGRALVVGEDGVVRPGDYAGGGSGGITQEAGESESLVMSQKAVTDLVADALETIGSSYEYETVDSVEEMTDTGKQYVLSSTGTLWAYGQHGAPQPDFTNLADPTSSDWSEGNRLNSSGVLTAQDDFVTTNFIEVTTGDVIRVRGMDLATHTYARVVRYNASKAVSASSKISGTDSQVTDVTYDTTSAQFTIAHDTVKFVRFTAPLISSADIIITKNEEITYSTGCTWYDTGITPEAGTSGGNYVQLLVQVNNNAADIAHTSARLTALETGGDSITVPAFWQDAVDVCISKIKALQTGKNCVTFAFFSDNHQRNGYAGILITHIMKECGIPYCFFGGDTISNGYLTESEMLEQDKAFDASMSYIPEGRFCRAVGNHDGFWNDNGTTGYYTREQIYELFLRAEGTAQNKHFGEDGTYYYVDDIASKIRFIVLNTNSEPVAAGNESVNAAQLAWLTDSALPRGSEGWQAVIVSHCPISNHYHANVSNSAEVITALHGAAVDIVGWFSGHIHRDRMYTHMAVGGTSDAEGTDGDALGFTEVTITSDNTSIAYDDATKHTIANDDQSHAIDFVTINRSARTVHLTRLGIGDDRSYTY